MDEYDLSDPKHPTFYDRMADVWDNRDKFEVSREICLRAEDFDPFLREKGIDPKSVTEYEWRKFSDAFLDGTHWDEVAGYAADIILLLREEK